MRGIYIKARVKLRRGEHWKVKPEAEQLDGQMVRVIHGWDIGPEDSTIYVGEEAWTLHPTEFEKYSDCPAWIASGDLQFGKDD